MTQESKWFTVEERKPRSLLLMPFRFIGWCVLWVVVLALTFNPRPDVAAWIAVVLAFLCTAAPRIVTKRYRVKR
jgi:hypothetical protein